MKRSETVSHKNETGWHDLVVFSPVTAWNRVFMSGTKRLAGVVEEDDRDGSTIEAGSTVLLLASCSEAPGREACRDLLTVSPTTRLNVLYVAFTNAGRNHLEWLTTEASLSPDRVTMIDAAPGPPRPPSVDHDGLVVDPVGSPGNLTKIGVAISEHCKEFEGGGTTVVCLRSLTALLQYIENGVPVPERHRQSTRYRGRDRTLPSGTRRAFHQGDQRVTDLVRCRRGP